MAPPSGKRVWKAPFTISKMEVKDVRFPTSKGKHGSDAMHKDPDYSAAYVVLHAEGTELKGHGFTFTLGQGTDIVTTAVRGLEQFVVGRRLENIYNAFGAYWRELTSHSQLRWIGPEKGVIHLATAAVINALWDFWAKIEGKPVWELLSCMSPEEIVSLIDFRYLTDTITPEEAVELLRSKWSDEEARKKRSEFVPLGPCSILSSLLSSSRCLEALKAGFTRFKVKVGQNVEDDRRRCAAIRDIIGYDKPLMTDANQVWDVKEAITHMAQLAEYKPLFIEEPTSPDDIHAHLTIRKALSAYGIKVATGEQCCNRVMFKQFLEARAFDVCQIDSCRIGGVNEILSVILMAGKFGVPVCPHAGGVGLCELVQHLAMFDFVAVSGTLENRFIEFVDHLHEHFLDPVNITNGHYIAPTLPGYSAEMKPQSLDDYEYGKGCMWTTQQ
ncbi:mitochondrial enolase superfamily member 1-like [Sycon ciliatum]|uniref:mitochondrial enolase superfamily member 1-like n=1 Tax=Sycon ciliatum TaxID=27933 RepID=UPI0031F60F77